MRRYITPIAAGFISLLAAPTVAFAQDAIVTTDLNMRAGPSTSFPVVDVVPGSTPVDIHGCVAGYSWCDVSADGNRGWVYSGYLSYAARGSYVPLVEYVSEIDVPIISFSVGSYWDTYYRGRPWYGERSRWGDRWQSNWRGIRRGQRDDRVERRIDRREDSVERRGDRRDMRGDRRVERRDGGQDGRSERRVNRVERRMDRGDGRVGRPGGDTRQLQRQEQRGAPRSDGRGDRQRSERRGRD